MVRSYGFSITGSSHESKGTKCQDANKVCKLENGTVIAAVADGVGSCKYADVASQIAVDVATAFCEEKLKTEPAICVDVKLLEEAFSQAELAIEKQSLNDDEPLSEYDTTLDLVVYDGKRVVYGHCGDGGTIGLTVKGDYVKITTPQKNEGIFVVPLRNGSKNKNNTWEFGCVENDLVSVLLATDGVHDIFFPYLLKGQPVEVYVPLIRYFMDNTGIHVSEDTIEKISEAREAFINSSDCKSITDDKTLLVLINEDIIPERKDDSYYAEPDWDALKLEWDKKAYPHLYGKQEVADMENIEGPKGEAITQEDPPVEEAETPSVTDTVKKLLGLE